MIVSRRHRYVFVELPHTGSSAISRELLELYDGRRILWKHAYYHQFLDRAGPEERRYFVFSCIRNPLDEAVSIFLKYKNDHKGNYSTPARWKRNGGWVSDAEIRRYEFIHSRGADFPAFLQAFYRMPYDNWSSLDHHRFDFVIRFEHLQKDFGAALRRIGLESKRPLPARNPTEGKTSFEAFYTPDTYRRAVWVFGPFMRRWGYEFPSAWNITRCPWTSRLLYELSFRFRNAYRRHLDRSPRDLDAAWIEELPS